MMTSHPFTFLVSLVFLLGTAGAIRANDNYPVPNTRTAADSVITFNEIMYHPAGDDSGLEWIELHNQMSLNMDISNWRIEGGIDFQFPTNTVLPSNGYLVIAAEPDRLRALTGRTNIVGAFTKRLSNSGEVLRLRNNSQRLMDEISFSDEEPWPLGADGSGSSLSKRDRYDASSPAGNWRPSAEPGGTPGRENFSGSTVLAPTIAFHEIAAAGSTNFFFELINYGPEPITLAGCRILFSSGRSFPLGT
ncbi:MAG TPA: lamin tail domain-containing protein, partial [Verrucomicrobiae bacterium]|nr:lamin tail domain-containing protein [Verrucomicrobiae bacterium]